MTDRLFRFYVVSLLLLIAIAIYGVTCADDRAFACGGYTERARGCR